MEFKDLGSVERTVEQQGVWRIGEEVSVCRVEWVEKGVRSYL